MLKFAVGVALLVSYGYGQGILRCPGECEYKPCGCCEEGMGLCKECHANGCDQCDDSAASVFKRGYSYYCEYCADIFGDACNFCQDTTGCGQCKDFYDQANNIRYERTLDSTSGLYYCKPQNVDVYVASCGSTIPNSYPDHDPDPSCEAVPTFEPSEEPTKRPSPSPTDRPTDSPSYRPTKSPTDRPSNSPTDRPTESPTERPTSSPTERPTNSPTDRPSRSPTDRPTMSPTNRPSNSPTDRPSNSPTDRPSNSPTDRPTGSPTDRPSNSPTNRPSRSPTDRPTMSPSVRPTRSPSDRPTNSPTDRPSKSPTDRPTMSPTDRPSKSPTDRPTMSPSDRPTKSPTDRPTMSPTDKPSQSPTDRPSESPSDRPTKSPSNRPTKSPVNECPNECKHNPCKCDEPDLNCLAGTCHVNGCDQCKPGYFKLDYNYKCVQCQETFGKACLHCTDFLGCQQCEAPTMRAYDAECGLYYCEGADYEGK